MGLFWDISRLSIDQELLYLWFRIISRNSIKISTLIVCFWFLILFFNNRHCSLLLILSSVWGWFGSPLDTLSTFDLNHNVFGIDDIRFAPITLSTRLLVRYHSHLIIEFIHFVFIVPSTQQRYDLILYPLWYVLIYIILCYIPHLTLK